MNMIALAQSVFPQSPALSGCWFDFMSAGDLSFFTTTAISSGTATVITGRNGILQISSVDGTDNKGAQIQLSSSSFRLADNKEFSFATRASVSDIDQSDLLVGLAVTDASLINSAPSDGIFFQKGDGDSRIRLVIQSGGVNVAVWPLQAMVADTYMDLAFKITALTSGTGTLTCWVNNVIVLSTNIAGLPTSTELALSAAFQSGEAVLKTANIDCIGAFQTR